VSVPLEFRVRITIVTPPPHACTTAPPYPSTTMPYTSATAFTLSFVRSFQFHSCLFQSPWEVPVPRQEEEEEQKKSSKKKFQKKSQIRIQVGLTWFLLVQSEFSSNWTVLSVFDSFRHQTSIGHNFCIRTPFSTCDHSKCSAQKVLSSTATLWLYNLRNAQTSEKSPGRSSFCPLKFQTKKFLQIFTYILLLSCFFLLVVSRRDFLSVPGSRL
jgi:hypothetical protein